MSKKRTYKLVDFIKANPRLSVSDILAGVAEGMSLATLKRDIAALMGENQLLAEGQGKATRYFASPAHYIFAPVDVGEYFENDIDQREIHGNYNFELIDTLAQAKLFTVAERTRLDGLQHQFRRAVAQLPSTQYQKRWSVWRSI